MRSLATLLTISLVISACSEGLAPREQVVDLRVLGVRLTPPSVMSGESVVADALVMTPEGQETTLTWYACLEPISSGAYFAQSVDRNACTSGESKYGTLLGQGESATFRVPDDFMTKVYAELEASGFEATDGEMSSAVQGLLAVAGWYLQVTLIAESDAGERVEVQKRLVVTLFPDQNDNPEPPTFIIEPVEEGAAPAALITSAQPNLEGACLSPDSPLRSLENETVRITPVNLPDPAPTYPVIDFGGELVEREETLFYSWFSSIRGLGSPVSQSPDKHPIGFEISTVEASMLVEHEGALAIPLWVVVRDGRGGTSWCSAHIPFVGEVESVVPSAR